MVAMVALLVSSSPASLFSFGETWKLGLRGEVVREIRLRLS